MRIVRTVTVACLSIIAFAGIGGGIANARTPTPTRTSVPTATSTPAPPEPAEFDIFPWINAENTAREVIADIGGTLCATGVALVPPSSPPGGRSRVSHYLSVPSEQVRPGCGYEGAVVTFSINGMQAPQTGIWHSGGMPQMITAIIGPPFTRFSIWSVQAERVLRAGGSAVPYIGSTACGNEEVAYSNEQEAGCGVEGSQIRFKLLDSQGNFIAVADQTVTWHAWDGVSYPQRLDLTFSSLPNTGTGEEVGVRVIGSRLAALLGMAGFAAATLGFGLRRRAVTR
jgi:hypothetical protein